MNAAAARTAHIEPSAQPHLSVPLTASLIFHIIIILLCIFGLPFLHKTPPPESQPLSIELVNPSATTQATKPPMRAPMKQPPMVQKPTPPVPHPTPPQTVQPAAPTPPEKPQPETKSEVPPPPDELALPKKKPPPKPVKEPPKQAAKPDQPKQMTKQEQDQFNSLLKNVIKTTPTAAASPDAPADSQTPTPDAPVAASMSSDELAALTRQLESCWSIVAGAANAESLAVDVKLDINQDRTLKDASIVDQMKYNTDTYYRAAADSAIRALHDPHCSPLDVPPDKYDYWKTITVTFDPSQMLN